MAKIKAANERSRQKLQSEGAADISFAPLSWWRERWKDLNIRRQFIENFIFVRDAFDENKLTRLVLNDLQKDLLTKVARRDVVIKFRRGGLSTFWKASFFADAVVTSGCNVRIVPHDPDTETQFRADVRVMYENLPAHLKPDTRYYSEELIEFHDPTKGTINSRISTASVQPGHEGKGRGQTITHLLMTEPPFWRGDQKKAATALLEAAAGGRVVVESTPFGIEWAYDVYQQGKAGKGGWTSHFYEWWWKRDYRVEGARFVAARGATVLLKPKQSLKDVWRVSAAGASEAMRAANRLRFDAAKVTKEELKVGQLILAHLKRRGYATKRANVFCNAVAEYLAWRRDKIEELPGGENQFAVEYPENDRDCFEQSGRPVVAAKWLKVTCAPAEPVLGCEYAIGVDTSLGLENGDPAAIQIIDIHSGRQAHEEILKRPPDLLAFRVAELSELYNGALMIIERNGPGIATIRKLLEMGYGERVYRHLDERLKRSIEDGKMSAEEAWEQSQEGFPTSTATKPLIGLAIEEGIRTGGLGISSQAFCDEAKTVVWFDNGTFGALSGYHDDRFMALGIVWLVSRSMLGQWSGFVGVMPETGYARA